MRTITQSEVFNISGGEWDVGDPTFGHTEPGGCGFPSLKPAPIPATGMPTQQEPIRTRLPGATLDWSMNANPLA